MSTAAYRSRAASSAQSDGNKPRSTGFARGKKPENGTPPQKVSVCIAAENRLLSEALTRMLAKHESVQVNTVEFSGAAELQRICEAQPGVLLLSSRGNIANDLQTIQNVRRHAPEVRILLLGMSNNEQEFLQCVRAGVSGYLLQDASGEEVLQAVEAVAAGEAVCRGTLCGALFRYFEREMCGVPSAAVRRKLGFSRREQQLIPLIAQGLTNKEIANHFSLSEQTVKNHVYRMKHKVGAEDRLDIVQIYRVQGFLV